MNNIGLLERKIIYNDNIYNNYLDIESFPSKKIKIIIFDRELLIKKYQGIRNKNDIDFILREKMSEDIPIQDDILIHYEHDCKNKILYIYSLKGGNAINEISDLAEKLSVEPIEFCINSYVKGFNKFKKNYGILAHIFNKNYFLVIINGLISESYILSNLEEIHEYDSKTNYLFIDKSISSKVNFCNKKKVKSLVIGEKIYERLFKKKRIFT